MITAEQLLKAASLKVKDIDTDAGVVRVRELSISARSEFLKVAKDTPEKISAWLVANCAIDENGKLLFGNARLAEIENASPELIEQIAKGVIDLSGLGDSAKKS
jgi:hypothetical protein